MGNVTMHDGFLEIIASCNLEFGKDSKLNEYMKDYE